VADPAGYRALADLLREQIASGVAAPGQNLPSEGALAQTYGLSITTARRALAVLRNEGLIDVRAGYPPRVRVPPDLEDVTPQPGDVIHYRQPTAQERDEQGIPDGVVFLLRIPPDGEAVEYRGDQYRFRLPD
jgi:DNA-binding transcriptional MocR family regulator